HSDRLPTDSRFTTHHYSLPIIDPRISTSRGFRHLPAAQAARAHANPSHSAVDHRLHRLQVRLEAPGADVVRVTVLPAYDRRPSADLTFFRHDVPQFLTSLVPHFLSFTVPHGTINRGVSCARGVASRSALSHG